MTYPEETLAWIERHIAEGDVRLSAQIDLIEQMTGNGHDISQARGFLEALTKAQERFYAQRRRVLDRAEPSSFVKSLRRLMNYPLEHSVPISRSYSASETP